MLCTLISPSMSNVISREQVPFVLYSNSLMTGNVLSVRVFYKGLICFFIEKSFFFYDPIRSVFALNIYNICFAAYLDWFDALFVPYKSFS